MSTVHEAQDNASKEQFSSDVAELQKTLKDALAKNQQWLAYNQQREAYVRTVVDRMLWLDNQLDRAVRAQLTQHNEEHSEAVERTREMKEHFESLLVIGRDNLVIIKQQLDVTRQDLADTKNRYKEKEMEASELKQQLQRCSEEKELMMDEVRALQGRLDEEKSRAAKLELQRFMVKRHNATQDKIADLEEQVHSSSLDLEDEMENSSYLKTQLVRLLNMLQRSDDKLAYYEKKQQEEDYKKEDEEEPVYEEMRPFVTSSPNDSSLDRSYLDCPVCRIRCPAQNYRQMLDHLEVCLN
ncbi:centrosomal protein of 55 kDa-like [Festucalex cinctus]